MELQHIILWSLPVTDKFSRKMKDLERYIGANYSNNFQPAIMNETPETFPYPEIPTIIPETGVERPKMDTDTAYLKNNNIDEAVRQKLRKKDVYDTEMHNI